MSETFSHGYALLIGVGKSAYPKWSLPVTVKDMQALQAVLTDPFMCGYINDESHICLLHDTSATRQAILDGLKWLADQTAADEEATAIVFYSGHGWLNTDTGSYYLLPHDIDPQKVTSSALSAEIFTKSLRLIKAKRLLVLMDCCHAAGMALAKDARGLKCPKGFAQKAVPKGLAEELKQGEGRAVFSSSTNSQRSWIRLDSQLSIYTHHLIEALYGAGNQTGDTVVRLSNLMNHLGKSVQESAHKAWNEKQTPFFNTATEDFPVALLWCGKGLPSSSLENMQAEMAKRMQRLVSGVGIGEPTYAEVFGHDSTLSSENPFQPLNGRITDLKKVFDRDLEVQVALDFLRAGSSLVFLGDHGVGKSSLLTLLLDRVREKLCWETAYINLQMVENEQVFFRELCEMLGVATARGYHLGRALNGRHILLALDEVEKMTWEGFTRNLRAELRGLAECNNAPLKLALATSTSLDRLFPDSQGGTSPLAGICSQINVHPWMIATARGFLLERLKETPVTFSDAEMQNIFQASGGVPQLLMQQAFGLYSQKRGKHNE